MFSKGRFVLVFLMAGVLGGCGGGDGGFGPGDLQGTWLGTADDPATAGGSVKIEVTFDSNGDITKILKSGAPTGKTATLVASGGRLFDFDTGGGNEASAFLAKTGKHLAFIDDQSEVAVLQKGLTSLPMFQAADAVGDYEGTEFVLDSSFGVVNIIDSSWSVQASAPLSFTLQENEAPNCKDEGPLNAPNSLGLFTGTFTNKSGGSSCFSSGDVKAYLSGDARFATVVACDDVTNFPSKCSFIGFTKQ